jgi:hypothetical protein
MSKYILEISVSDECVYLYDVETHTLRGQYDITSPSGILGAVKEILKKANLPLKIKEHALGDNYIRLKATEDDCVYLFDLEKGTVKKICDIEGKNDFPPSIIRQIRDLKKNAAGLPDV